MCGFRDFTSAWCRNPVAEVAVGLENMKRHRGYIVVFVVVSHWV